MPMRIAVGYALSEWKVIESRLQWGELMNNRYDKIRAHVLVTNSQSMEM